MPIYLAWIHPIGDGNGRTARLIEFHLLLANGVPATAAQLLSNHYNQTRTEYYRQLDQSSKAGGQIIPFVRYALQGFVDGLQGQLAVIRQQQVQVHWVNYVHECFGDQESATSIRQRRLVLDLSEQVQPVALAKIRHISPRLAEAYAGKSEKTIQRDLATLTAMNLLRKTIEGYVVHKELMLAFAPESSAGQSYSLLR